MSTFRDHFRAHKCQTTGYKAAYRVLNQPQILGASYRLLTPETFSIQIMLLLVGIGILIGALGSVISMRRFLKI